MVTHNISSSLRHSSSLRVYPIRLAVGTPDRNVMREVKDSRKSWFVLGVVSFSVFLEVGLTKSVSVLLPDIKEQYW